MIETSNAPAVESGGADESVSQAGIPKANYTALLAGLAGYLTTLPPDQCDTEAQYIADQFGEPVETVWADLCKRHPIAWRESGRGLEAARNATRFRLVLASDLQPRPMDWLVSGLVERDSLLQIFGDPGAAKTFMALDLAACIATGTDYHGRAVKQGPVVFIAGEGQNGLARRRKAWEIRNRAELKGAPFWFSTSPAAITDSGSVLEVLESIAQLDESPELIVLDTLARNFGPGDENSTQDMTAFVRGCDELRIAYSCTVALVHHTGHGDKSRARGSTVLNGAVDTAYRLTRDNDVIRVNCAKAKDCPEPEPFAFEFRAVELGFENEDGTQATSAVLHPVEVPAVPPAATGKNQNAALEQLEKVTARHRANLERAGKDPNTARVSLDDWRTACIDGGMPRRSWYDAKAALDEKRLIEIQPGGYVCRRTAGE